jgi:tripartite-type tricarboxylate transporter receptor subunit TctC
MTLSRRIFLTLAGGTALAALPFAALAEGWQPKRPIDFTIMAGSGGGADQIARFIQSAVEADGLTNRPLIPTNRGGGSGAEALLHLKDTGDADHTLMVTLNSFYTTPIRQADLGVDIETFTPITMMGVDPFILWVHKESGITTFEEYIAKVKEMDGEYVMGGTGTGQEDSIVITYLQNAFDLKLKYIPFDGGGAVAKELAGQQIMATVNNPSEAKGFYQAGDLVPLLAFRTSAWRPSRTCRRSKKRVTISRISTSGPLSVRRACRPKRPPTTASCLARFMTARSGRPI